MKKQLLSIALSLALLTGCSSIVSRSDYAVSINSVPDGANYVITNRAGIQVHSGLTPSTVTLKSSSGFFKGETYNIALKRDGYADQTFTLASTVDGWYFGNILFGGLIGMLIVDPATGAMYTLPTVVSVPMDPNVSSANETTLMIASIESLSLEEISRLQRIQ